jgi:hypothetical protein
MLGIMVVEMSGTYIEKIKMPKLNDVVLMSVDGLWAELLGDETRERMERSLLRGFQPL